MTTTLAATRIKAAPEALALELEPRLVTTVNVYELAQKGRAEVWLDILPSFVGPQDIEASQAAGLFQALEDLLLVLAETCPRAWVEVDSKGSAVLWAR